MSELTLYFAQFYPCAEIEEEKEIALAMAWKLSQEVSPEDAYQQSQVAIEYLKERKREIYNQQGCARIAILQGKRTTKFWASIVAALDFKDSLDTDDYWNYVSQKNGWLKGKTKDFALKQWIALGFEHAEDNVETRQVHKYVSLINLYRLAGFTVVIELPHEGSKILPPLEVKSETKSSVQPEWTEANSFSIDQVLGVAAILFFAVVVGSVGSVLAYNFFRIRYEPEGVAIVEGRSLDIELATTARERVKGLASRSLDSFPVNRAFVYPSYESEFPALTTKGIKFPIDLIYLKEGEVVRVERDIPPCKDSDDFCPVYTTEVPVDYLLQLRGGIANKLEIDVGDRVDLKY